MKTNAAAAQDHARHELDDAWAALQQVLQVPAAKRTWLQLAAAMQRWERARDAHGQTRVKGGGWLARFCR